MAALTMPQLRAYLGTEGKPDSGRLGEAAARMAAAGERQRRRDMAARQKRRRRR